MKKEKKEIEVDHVDGKKIQCILANKKKHALSNSVIKKRRILLQNMIYKL